MVLPYLEENKERFLDELKDFLKIPSVSADSKFKEDVLRAANYVKENLQKAGADNIALMETGGYPIVYGEKLIDASLPTILVYGHYDVQPADPYELWDSPPFEPVVKNERLYARGACDDKGQMYMHVKAFESMMKTDTLPCNVKFIFEGEEEVGSDNLAPFLEKYKDKLKADVVLVSDTAMLGNDTPSIDVSLRGLCYMEVFVEGPNRDLHSGTYGGQVPNPINILTNILAGLTDENNHITIEGFYDDIVKFSQEDVDALKKIPLDVEKFKESIGINDVFGEEGYSTIERRAIRPTLDINGIWGGYQGEGAKTVIASKAGAKVSMRLVPNQDPDKIAKLFEAHIQKLAPKAAKVSVKAHHGGHPAITPTDSIAYKAAEKAMTDTFGKKPVPAREGASIPIVADFERILGLKTVLLGFGLNIDAIHSPNESFGLFNYYKGIETIPLFYKYFTELSK